MLPQEIFYILTRLALASPILAFLLLAFRGWIKHTRKDLPRWRNALGAASFLVITINFLVLTFPFLVALGGLRFRANISLDIFVGAVFYSVPIGTALGFALKGISRLQLILAGVLTFAFFVMNLETF
jgi:hypothetical protein